DLFYRLNVVAIETLPLRQRPEDVPVLAARYLAELASRHGMPLCTLAPAAVEALQGYAWPGNVRELENVLERAVMFSSGDEIDSDDINGLMRGGPAGIGGAACVEMDRAAGRGIVAPTPLPGVYRVEPRLRQPDRGSASPPVSELPNRSPAPEDVNAETNAERAFAEPAPAARGEEWLTLADVERMHLERTLAATMNNKSLAAKILGIDRSVLRRKLQRYGLDERASQPSAED
ncbi:MAG: helix-turn-helix domain-containing protein, partial [Actinomycetota bacterium]